MNRGSLVRYKPEFDFEGFGLVLSEPVKWDEQAPAGTCIQISLPSRAASAATSLADPDYFWIKFLWNNKICWEYVEALEIVG